MRSFTNVDTLLILLLALGVCVMANLRTTALMFDWVYDNSVWLLHQISFYL
ncbi:MAG: hypothetical protein ACRD68_12690 [Pyrinomonadaceae bacterium]